MIAKMILIFILGTSMADIGYSTPVGNIQAFGKAVNIFAKQG